MKRYVGLILALIISADVIMSFVNDKEVENVFGIEMNVWRVQLEGLIIFYILLLLIIGITELDSCLLF